MNMTCMSDTGPMYMCTCTCSYIHIVCTHCNVVPILNSARITLHTYVLHITAEPCVHVLVLRKPSKSCLLCFLAIPIVPLLIHRIVYLSPKIFYYHENCDWMIKIS